MSEYDRITTYEAADRTGARDHAAWYSDLTHRLVGASAGPADVVEEIARTTALAETLRRQRPLLFHRAARSGVEITELAAAAGISPAQVCAEWRAWADGQRQLAQSAISAVGGGTSFGIDAAEYAAAEATLGVDGVRRIPEFSEFYDEA